MTANTFEILLKNWTRKNELDALLFESDKDLNEEIMRNRSSELRSLWAENSGLIAELEERLSDLENNPLSDEYAEYLYKSAMEMYYGDCDDMHITGLLLDALIPYYHRKRDYSKLVNLHAVKSYQQLEVLNRFTGDVTPEAIIQVASDILAFKPHYKELSVDARRKIFSTYYNLCIVCLDSNKIDINTSYYYLQDLLKFWNSPEVQQLDKDDERIAPISDRVETEWLGFSHLIGEAAPEVKEYFLKSVKKIYSENKNDGKEDFELSFEIYGAHMDALVYEGEITPQDGFKELLHYYMARRQFLKNNHVENNKKLIDMSYEYMDYLYFFINSPQMIISWIERFEIPRDMYLPFGKIYIRDLHNVWNELYQNLPAPFLDEFVMRVCLVSIGFDDKESEQLKWLEKLLVKRDLPTYIHSKMVADLSYEIAKDILENKPSIFDGIFGYSEAEIIDNSDDILKFISNAAIFHDIGKTKIGNVINIQTRKINEKEFDIIKTHPEQGKKIAEQVEPLRKYMDVILGHHKYYDGSKGYPEYFDNTSSPIRAIIDLVTVCDCLDAATDCFGRNYNGMKTTEEVLREIYEQRGTRYNPEIAEYLCSSPHLYRKISELTKEKRIEKYRWIKRINN